MTVRVSVGSCRLFIQGLDMQCPLCKTLVRSGEHHECRIEKAVPRRIGRTKKPKFPEVRP